MVKANAQRLIYIVGRNTFFAIILAVGVTYISIAHGWKIDFPLTILGIAIVFPIVFSISGAYARRESALVQYATMKSMGRMVFFIARDWIKNNQEQSDLLQKDIQENIYEIFTLSVKLFQTKKARQFSHEEHEIYKEFSTIADKLEVLRENNVSATEIARAHGYLASFITAFETLKHIYQYRTPRTLRLYSKLFIYIILIVLGPYFAFLAEGQAYRLGYVNPILFAIVFTALDNIQEQLENPFDQIGEDDIHINPAKFVQTLS